MKTLIAGMGVTGIAVAHFLNQKEIPFETYDDQKSRASLTQALGPSLVHHSSVPNLSRFKQVIVSPGLATTHPLIVAAQAANVPILSEVELASRHHKGTVIAVTGSNGKSTTVSLIHHLLKELNCKLCGNIGVPFISVVNDDPDRIYVLEISSFQMEHVAQFHCHIGILLNVAADHLDRHGSLEVYREAKLRLFANQTDKDYAFSDAAHVEQLPGSGLKQQLANDSDYVGETALMIDGEPFLALDQLQILGVHNYNNCLFAIEACRKVGLSDAQIREGLKDFQSLAHRMEKVGHYKERLWINDSKATNIHATQAAITALNEPYVLILGGYGKGESFTTLDFSQRSPRHLVAYGKSGPQIVAEIKDPKPIFIEDFQAACLKAHDLSQEGDAVLLAPGCASFDQFSSFKARGQAFKDLFAKLSEVRP